MSCALETSVAAYALGTLDAGDRAEVADHLPGCPSCRAALQRVAGLPGLLARVPSEAAASGLPRPEQRLLDRVLVAASHETAQRRRRRRVLAVAAAAALVLGGAGALAVAQRDVPWDRSTTLAGAQGAVQARVELQPSAAGTELTLELSGVAPGQECRLVAVGADGTRDVAATWQASYTGQATIRGHTAVEASLIDRFVVETLDRQTLVVLPVRR